MLSKESLKNQILSKLGANEPEPEAEEIELSFDSIPEEEFDEFPPEQSDAERSVGFLKALRAREFRKSVRR